MATWKQFHDEAPELATIVHAQFTATKHHVLATLRADGSPRISGTEVDFGGDHLTLGSMPEARKAHDLQRDPRYALHSNPGDGSMTVPDVKISGRAVEVVGPEFEAYRAAHTTDLPPGPFHLFRLGIDDVVLAGLNDARTGMEIRLWRPGLPVRTFTR
ncbi:pyridoxamine 5'-phosphate oxidase family protein [Jiangella aurantiaca]|uniref:Pyridoxamine 5'-phosphate oxidase family protein n=1 Tax=Jiangella aurantiaca TaxID=2530373 RepID=A0A4R5AGR1_9ACTN|nr:pyridoxamine 5'-phosphate oxidase family protein [Jiangella aurantiaca]TDD70449.1 pyridoxamine 5'-phosphate oxidase family protein [Jiangella aurantiaca]